MKVFVGMPAYNEELIIGPAIRSVYDYVDNIFVINGSKEGPSTDKTAEEAKAVGPKVKVVDGTFIAKDGSWGEQKQRQMCLDMMPKGDGNWCIMQDADEVFDDPQIQCLLSHMENTPPETRLFAYVPIHFFRDLRHVMVGGDWSAPRWYQAFRLTHDVRMISHNKVGVGSLWWDGCKEPIRCLLSDVFYYHYGHVLSFERSKFKQKHFVEQGLCRKFGYEPHEWERFRKEKFIPYWEKQAEDFSGCRPYLGSHPEEVRSVLDKLEQQAFSREKLL